MKAKMVQKNSVIAGTSGLPNTSIKPMGATDLQGSKMF